MTVKLKGLGLGRSPRQDPTQTKISPAGATFARLGFVSKHFDSSK